MSFKSIYKFTMKNHDGEALVAANDEEHARKRIKKLWPDIKIKEIEFECKNKKKEKD